MASSPSLLLLFQKRPNDNDDNDARRGRHLVAATHLFQNQLIFVERPLVALPSTFQQPFMLVCGHCRSFVGGPQVHLALTVNQSGRKVYSRQEICEEYYPKKTSKEYKERYPMIACRHHCGQVYCSKACQEDHYAAAGHAFLCTGRIPLDNDEAAHNHPLIQFKQHAIEHNEIFLMVADVIVAILASPSLQFQYKDSFCMNLWWDVATASLKTQQKFKEANELEEVLRRLCTESSSLLRQALEAEAQLEMIHGEDDDDDDDDDDSTIIINNINNIIQKWCTPDMFARIVGSFEQNAIGIRQRHVMCRDVLYDKEHCRQTYHNEILECIRQSEGKLLQDNDSNDNNYTNDEMEQHSVEPTTQASCIGDTQQDSSIPLLPSSNNADDLDAILSQLELDPVHHTSELDDLDNIFAPLDGTAMFHNVCKMNHSCVPNVAVLFRPRVEWGEPLVAHCVALRDIAAGEELCISYLDSWTMNDATVQQRQEALADYGFMCQCPKCLSEEGALPHESVVGGDMEEEYLFGSDGDSCFDGDADGNAEEVNGKLGTEQLQLQDDSAAAQLAKRLQEMNRAINENYLGSVPVGTLAVARIFVVQVGTSALNDDSYDWSRDSKALDLLRDCLHGVQHQDYCGCQDAGMPLEELLLTRLQSTSSWPHVGYREAYWCAALCCAMYCGHVGRFLAAQAVLDKAIILGLRRERVRAFVDYVEHFASEAAYTSFSSAMVESIKDSTDRDLVLREGLSRPIEHPVAESNLSMSQEVFQQTYESRGEPVVLREFAAGWDALTKWRNLRELVQVHGHRLLPIEMGSMMSKDGMKEEIMTLRDFVVTYLVPSCRRPCWTLSDATTSSSESRVAYLAQHPLLDQISALASDVEETPQLCGKESLLHRNVWMGTGGTRTPLHFDSYDNILVQVVGYKYVRLYDAAETFKLYVTNDTAIAAQRNMSAVDCELEHYGRHPLARDATYRDVVLGPGDALFIPSGMWHYVRSLSTSMSVNYWW